LVAEALARALEALQCRHDRIHRIIRLMRIFISNGKDVRADSTQMGRRGIVDGGLLLDLGDDRLAQELHVTLSFTPLLNTELWSLKEE